MVHLLEPVTLGILACLPICLLPFIWQLPMIATIFIRPSLLFKKKSNPPSTFPLFPSLPLEIRLKIWSHALPGSRAIHIYPRYGNVTPSLSSLTTVAESYGHRHPSILSVNRESRQEALRYLRPLLRAYWNVEIDIPCFEGPFHQGTLDATTVVRLLRETGELAAFRRLGLDWRMVHDESDDSFWEINGINYEHPFTTIRLLPNIEECIVTYVEAPPGPPVQTFPQRWEPKTLGIKALKGPWRLSPISNVKTGRASRNSFEEQYWNSFKERFESEMERMCAGMEGKSLKVSLMKFENRYWRTGRVSCPPQYHR